MLGRGQVSQPSHPATQCWWQGSGVAEEVTPVVLALAAAPIRVDPLTGALNRQGLLAVLKQIAADHPFGEEISVLVIGLERVTPRGDAHSDQPGDLALQAIVDRLRRLVEPAGCVARLADDELGCFVRHERGSAVAAMMATTMLDTIAEPINVGGDNVVVHGIVGMATAPSGAQAPEFVLRSARLAMKWLKGMRQASPDRFVASWASDACAPVFHGERALGAVIPR